LALVGALSRIRTFESLRLRDFRLLFAASMGTSGGYFFQQVVIGWLAYEITRSPFLTLLAVSLDTLPNLIGGPLGGVLVDNLDRRKLLILVPAYQCILSVIFGLIILMGWLQTWHIFAFITLMGFSWVLVEPARMAITPGIVGEARLVNAFSLIQVAFNSTRVLGPLIGGVVLAAFGPAPTLFVEAGSQFMAVGMAILMRAPIQSVTRVTVGSAMRSLGESVRLVRDTPVLQGLMLFALLTPLIVVPFSNGLMPVFAAEVFGVGPARYGVLLSLIGVGAVVGTVVLASMGDVPHKGLAVAVALFTAAVGLFVLAASPSFSIAVVAALLIGAGYGGTQTLVMSLLQKNVAPEFRGRISGIWMMTWGTVVGGGLVAGWLASAYGAPTAAGVGGAIVIVAALAIGATYKSVRNLE
jgi:MFS family permease